MAWIGNDDPIDLLHSCFAIAYCQALLTYQSGTLFTALHWLWHNRDNNVALLATLLLLGGAHAVAICAARWPSRKS
ncbi:MAG: hypothetical protein FWG50_10315 [Kiritimatiellaeota bacterium]|nr:hypothetical protein [Kiritimatiellota bacterium]